MTEMINNDKETTYKNMLMLQVILLLELGCCLRPAAAGAD